MDHGRAVPEMTVGQVDVDVLFMGYGTLLGISILLGLKANNNTRPHFLMLVVAALGRADAANRAAVAMFQHNMSVG